MVGENVGESRRSGEILGAVRGKILGAVRGKILAAVEILGAVIGGILGAVIGAMIGRVIGAILGATIGTIVGAVIGAMLGAMNGDWLEVKIRGVGRINGLRDDQKQGDSKADQKPDGSKENQKPGGSKDDQKPGDSKADQKPGDSKDNQEPGGSKDDQKPDDSKEKQKTDAPNTNKILWSGIKIIGLLGIAIGIAIGGTSGGIVGGIIGGIVGIIIGGVVEDEEKRRDILIGTVAGTFLAIGVLCLLVFAIIIVVSTLIQGEANIENIENMIENIPPVSTAWLLMSTVILFLGWNLVRASKKKEEEEWQKKYFDEDKDNKDNNVRKRMQLNLESMKEFYTWTQTQAIMAFVLAVLMCIAGIVLICVAVWLSKSGSDLNIISIIGGVTTELIAGTALIVYRRSVLQLNHYHKALQQDQRILLGIEQLNNFDNSDKANSDKTSNILKDEMRKAIIQGLIDMNLAEVAQPEEEKADKNKADT